MKLLVITTNFPRWEGDPHSPWLVEMLGLLLKNGVAVDVLAPAYRGQGDHIIYGIPVHRFRYAPACWETLTHEEGAPNKIRRNPLYLLLLPSYLLFGLLAAWRLGRAGHYDVIHVHWPVPQGVFGLMSRLAGGGRLILTFYGADLVLAKRFGFVRPFLRYIVRHCDAVVAISSFVAQELVKATGALPQIIPYGVSLPPDAAKNLPTQAGMILTVGRLIPRKGQAYLIEAMALLSNYPEAHLVIVGEGPERSRLKALIRRLHLEDRVKLKGRISNEELAQLYATCQVFVLPSVVDPSGDTEMLGMVLPEAMGYRKPVISTRVGGTSDIIIDGETGLLVEEKNPHALAEAIARLLDDPALSARLAAAGYEHVRQHFCSQVVAQRMIDLYRRVTEGPP